MTSERKVVVITGASRGVNTIPGMPCIHHDQYDIDGIRVRRFTTVPKDATQRPAADLRAWWLPRIVELARTCPCLRGHAATRFTPSAGVVAAVRQRSTMTRS